MTPSARRALDPIELLSRLGDLGPPSEIRGQSPALAAGALGLDRVLLSGVQGGALFADSLHLANGDPTPVLSALRAAPVLLEYPLVEGEILRRRRAQIVEVAAGLAGHHAFGALLGWTAYVVAPVVVEGRVVGFLHGDRARDAGESMEPSDADGLAAFAVCFGIVFERAVLRQRLRTQRREMRQMATWADSRAGELGDRAIGLEDAEEELTPTVRTSGVGSDALRDLLTRRELEVLQLMVRGETNVAIARELVLSAGTVKFHVKNILRKLRVANRAEATSRYLRMTLDRGS